MILFAVHRGPSSSSLTGSHARALVVATRRASSRVRVPHPPEPHPHRLLATLPNNVRRNQHTRPSTRAPVSAQLAPPQAHQNHRPHATQSAFDAAAKQRLRRCNPNPACKLPHGCLTASCTNRSQHCGRCRRGAGAAGPVAERERQGAHQGQRFCCWSRSIQCQRYSHPCTWEGYRCYRYQHLGAGWDMCAIQRLLSNGRPGS